MANIDEVISLLRSIDETLKSQIVPLKAMAQQSVEQSAPKTPRPPREHLTGTFVITGEPRPYRKGSGNFYTATLNGRETCELGVSSSKTPRIFTYGDTINADVEIGDEWNGKRTYWLSAFVDNPPTVEPEIPSQEGNDDLPF